MAIELTGCLRHLDLTTSQKIRNIQAARAAGFAVDTFCVLEACSQNEVDAARSGALSNFVNVLQHTVGQAVNCTLLPQNDSVLGANGKLKPRYRPHGYPYPACRSFRMHLDRTVAQAHKLQQVGDMRREFSMRAGRPYDLVWRQRPDYVSKGLDWETIRRRLLCDVTRPCASSSATSADFVVPQVCVDGAHTDIEAILTPQAADHYDALVDRLPWLYVQGGGYFHNAESCLDAHMRTGTGGANHFFRHYVQKGWILYGCAPACFAGLRGSSPCRSVISGTKLQTIHNLTQCGLPRVARGHSRPTFYGPCSSPAQTMQANDPPMAAQLRAIVQGSLVLNGTGT